VFQTSTNSCKPATASRPRGLLPAFQMYVFLAMMAGFRYQGALFPVHTWLPRPSRSADGGQRPVPACSSRWNLRLHADLLAARSGRLHHDRRTPDRNLWSSDHLRRLCAKAQGTTKKLSPIPASAISVFAPSACSPQQAPAHGSLMQMINHGLSTGGLFLLVA